jgi:hypothetical protein
MLAAYRSAGVRRIILWPVINEIPQLEKFQNHIAPLARTSSP